MLAKSTFPMGVVQGRRYERCFLL